MNIEVLVNGHSIKQLNDEMKQLFSCECGICVCCLIDFIYREVQDEEEAYKQCKIFSELLF